jgi:hypothetical protein
MKAGSLAGVTDSSDAIQNLSRLWMPLGKRVAMSAAGWSGWSWRSSWWTAAAR